MTEKRFKAKRHCKDGNCHNFVLDKPNHRFVLMLQSWEDCKDVVDVLNELNDENNHIKQTIKEAYKTERTQIGQNVLKQLLESIE